MLNQDNNKVTITLSLPKAWLGACAVQLYGAGNRIPRRKSEIVRDTVLIFLENNNVDISDTLIEDRMYEKVFDTLTGNQPVEK